VQILCAALFIICKNKNAEEKIRRHRVRQVMAKAKSLRGVLIKPYTGRKRALYWWNGGYRHGGGGLGAHA